MAALTFKKYDFLAQLGIQEENSGVFYGTWGEGKGAMCNSINPSTGEPIARVRCGNADEYRMCIQKMNEAYKIWCITPGPKRGEIVRQIGEAVRAYKQQLGQLVSLEMGKIIAEGLGEIQEVIDICDYACGISRSIGGQVLPSERAGHTILETWNPLGLIGIVTAFNFPAAVFGWNTCISLICGNCQIWKCASTTPLVTIAMTKIVASVFEKNNLPPAVCSMIIGPGREIGDLLLNDNNLRLISFTGSTSIGKRVAQLVSGRFGRTILELGGNNAAICMDSANVEMYLTAITFGAVGTAGQRCTSTRRLLVHEAHYDTVRDRLVSVYKQIIADRIGNPLDSKMIMGPLHTAAAVKEYEEGLEEIKKQGGKVIVGGRAMKERPGFFVEPTIVEINHDAAIVKTELFVPILYLIKIKSVEEAIACNNEVPQGLSSTMFTQNMSDVFTWTSPVGSDCGLVNVNTGTSGAEIGGAFGGEKETGCGRESGSDSWKQYMRRSTCTINYSKNLPLAQGLNFSVNK